MHLTDDLEQHCRVCGWQLLDYSDEVIVVAFTKDISMKMKRHELKQQGQNAIEFSIGNHGQKKFGVFSSLILYGLDEIVKSDRWNMKRASVDVSITYVYTMLILV